VEIGEIVEGTITKIAKFGAFVKLSNEDVGLIHISEVANEYVNDISVFLKEGDSVRVKILAQNKKGQYDLSLKQALPKPKPSFSELPPPPSVEYGGKYGNMSFEDKLSKFLKDSEERQLDVKRNTESKRGRKSR